MIKNNYDDENSNVLLKGKSYVLFKWRSVKTYHKNLTYHKENIAGERTWLGEKSISVGPDLIDYFPKPIKMVVSCICIVGTGINKWTFKLLPCVSPMQLVQIVAASLLLLIPVPIMLSLLTSDRLLLGK